MRDIIKNIRKTEIQRESGVCMDNEAKKTEQLVRIYKEDTARENLEALVYQMKKTVFLTPAMLPDTPQVQEAKRKVRENPGQQVNLPKGTAPMPAILNSKNGDRFFPVYSGEGQIPKEPKADLLMHMPFKACCAMALDERLGVQGLVLNPFTDNLIFGKAILKAVRNDEALPQEKKQIKLTPGQFQIMMRQKVEFHDFPLRVYKEGAKFINHLGDTGESAVYEIYRNTYQQPEMCPYAEGDFSVMALNISEELLLVQVDLPPVKEAAQLCHRIYITLNPKNSNIHYFTIERGKGKDERILGGVDPKGAHSVYGEAPVEGAQIQRIMDILKRENEQMS